MAVTVLGRPLKKIDELEEGEIDSEEEREMEELEDLQRQTFNSDDSYSNVEPVRTVRMVTVDGRGTKMSINVDYECREEIGYYSHSSRSDEAENSQPRAGYDYYPQEFPTDYSDTDLEECKYHYEDASVKYCSDVDEYYSEW